jgi:hypothetical protein
MLNLRDEDERLLYRNAPVDVVVRGIVYPDLWGTGLHAWLEVRELTLQNVQQD